MGFFSRSTPQEAGRDYHAAQERANRLEKERISYNKQHAGKPPPAEHAKRHREIAKQHLTEAALRARASSDHFGGVAKMDKAHMHRVNVANQKAVDHLLKAAKISKMTASSSSTAGPSNTLKRAAPSSPTSSGRPTKR